VLPPPPPDQLGSKIIRRSLQRGELVRFVYRLGRQVATGLLTVTASGERPELLALRRGHALAGDTELAKKALIARLARLVAADQLAVVFEGGAHAMIPPGATGGVALADWARGHVEAQLDGALADHLVRQLAGIRLSIRPELAPEAIDEADRRMLVAMTLPRRLDQIWPLARTPRFRLLSFIHFLRAVGALVVEGVVAEKSAPVRRIDPRRAAALELLGVTDDAEVEDVKRAYRRLARSLHPDLQPEIDAERRRVLERRFAEVTAAYEALV
jgi:DnaJ-domain-containing protein 1